MLGMRGFYITKAEYDSIRKNLVSNNNQLIKIALQNLITKLEYGQRMNNVCSKDLCAVLYDVVQNDDYKIRKWAYHLIVYKQNRALVNRCIHNLKSGFEKVGYWRLCQDLITRICFTSYIKNVQIQKYHSKHILYALPCFLQIQICLTLKKSIILLMGKIFCLKCG